MYGPSKSVLDAGRNRVARLELVAIYPLIDGNLEKTVDAKFFAEWHGYAGTQVSQRGAAIFHIRIGSGFSLFSAGVDLQVRSETFEGHIANSQIHVDSRARAKIILGVQRLLYQGLREVVPVAAEGPELKSPDQQVRGAGSRLQAAIEQFALLGTGPEIVVITARRQLQSELEAKIV